jgi:hypothetical protein
MSKWADAFAALSREADTSDTSRQTVAIPSDVSRAVHNVTRPAQPEAAATFGEGDDERAAVVEHDGGIPRQWAEGFARLDPNCPPGDVPPRRWQRFVDDVGIFLDDWAANATALGWGPHDLFGCDHGRPFARIDRAGLLWLLNGNKLLALSENTATVEMRTGKRQTWRCKSAQPGRVLAWEINR